MFLYWILLPLLFGAVFTGLGLGLRRLTVPFSPALILPLGFSVTVLICTACTYWAFSTWIAAPLSVILALVGWFVGWRDLRIPGAVKRQRPWIVAGILGFLTFGATSITTGKPTFTGYNEIVDTSYQFDWASWLSSHGREFVPKGIDGFHNVASRTVEVGYPAGGQALIGTFSKTFGLEIAYVYQVFMTMVAACLILAAYAVLRQLVASRAFAAFGAFAVGQSSTLIAYGQLGGIKELTSATGLVAVAALLPMITLREGSERWVDAEPAADGDGAAAEPPAAAPAEQASGLRGRWQVAWIATKPMLPLSVAGASAFSCFSVTVLPWLFFMGLGALVMAWRALSLQVAIWRAVAAIVAMILLALPTVFPAVHGLGFANMQSSPTEVGNLAHPLAKWAATGVWLAADHRYQLIGKWHTASVILACVVIVLSLIGVRTALKRRQPSVVILGIACLIGMLILFKEMGPWVQLKGMVLMEPAMLLLAVVGVSTLLASARPRLRTVAWAGVIGLVVVGLLGDVLRYGASAPAPYERMQEARKFGEQFAGYKQVLLTDTDETVEYFMRRAGSGTQFNWEFKAAPATQADPSIAAFNYVWDPDRLDPAFMSTFPLIMTRHATDVSRPPSNFVLAAEGHYYDVWKRVGPTPALHVPLGGGGDPADTAKCEATIQALPKDSTVTIASTPASFPGLFDPKSASPGGAVVSADGVSMGWLGSGTVDGSVVTTGTTQTFDIYLQNLLSRKLDLTIDGKPITVIRDRTTMIHPAWIGTITLAPGTHKIAMRSHGTSLRTGTSKARNTNAYVGLMSFVPAGKLHPPLTKSPVESAVCPPKIDWIETP